MLKKTKKSRKRLAILELLKEAGIPLGSAEIADTLSQRGREISERTVRLYLKEMDEEGMTESVGRKGRQLTASGKNELGAGTLMTRVGYMSAKIDRMTYRMTFDLTTRSGSVVVNVTLLDPSDLKAKCDLICRVFEKGYAMGKLVSLLYPGEEHGSMKIPEGKVGFCTVCSVTLNGVLLKHGIPARSLFSGLLEVNHGKANHFADLINYDGTSLDPLELFIRCGLTSYLSAIGPSGTGRIGAGFREVPAEAYEKVVDLAHKLDRIGLGAFMTIGLPGQPLLNIPVRQGCCGAIVVGGLNPVAVFEESGIRVQAKALSGTMDFLKLFCYDELPERVRDF